MTAFYLTTAIAYPNGDPHIGHAYEFITTDAIARYKRLQGDDVYVVTGTDEHGIKMAQTAQGLGITAQELADRGLFRGRRTDDGGGRPEIRPLRRARAMG
jgi:methionyl-tRNA synthetase